jgi:hypothetical protein
LKRRDIFASKENSQRQTNKVKLLAAVGGPLDRYSIFKVFTLYVMCTQFKMSKEFFSFFSGGWIELVELHKKNYVSNFKKIFYEKL